MGASVRPDQFDRQAAKAAGYTDAEIDEFLGLSSPSVAPQPRDTGRGASDDPDQYGPAAGVLMSAAEGATFGLSRPIGAGLSAAAQKIGGDDRPMGDIYRGERDDLRRKIDTFREGNPVSAIGANVVGALASPVSSALNAVRVARGVGPMARAANAGVQGAIAGGVAGGANTAGDENVFANTALGAGLGGLGGSAFSGLADAGRQVARVAGVGPRAASDQGAVASIRRRMGSETAEQSGARRMATLLRRENMTVGDLATRSQAAPVDDIVAEQMGQRGVRGLRTARTLGDRAPTTIDDALTDRALNETSRLRDDFQRLTGASPQDAREVADAAMARVEPITRQLYQRVGNVPAGSGGSRRVADVVAELDADGLGVWRLARRLGGMPEQVFREEGLPADMTIGHALKVRQALDAMMDDAQTSADRIIQRRLVEARSAIDEVVKSGGGNASAAQSVQLADEIFANAKQIGQSFGGGVRASQSGNVPLADRIMREQGQPEMARAGVGSDILRRLGQVADEGRIQNPGPRVTGGDTQRQITRMAFPDDASFQSFRQSADDAGRRLGTLRAVSGGSQTADKLQDMADFATDPSIFTDMASGNVAGPLRRLASSGIARRLSTQNAAEADALTRYLLAGAPGQMSRQDAIAELVRLMPAIERTAGRQATRRGVAGAAVTGGLAR